MKTSKKTTKKNNFILRNFMNDIIAKDRKNKIISIGDIVKSKHGKKYKVIGFERDYGTDDAVVKVDPIEDHWVFRWGKELEVV